MVQADKNSTEIMRQLIDLAVSSGRSWQSPQTGFVHYCYTVQDEDVHHTIPVVENVLFSLALMRSKTSENISEAKELIDRLLHFQAEDGNFPVYLHDYPICKDWFLGFQLLPAFYWIYKNFHHVIGVDLKAKIAHSMHRLVEYCLKICSEKSTPIHLKLKVAAAAEAIGAMMDVAEFQRKGQSLLAEIYQTPQYFKCSSTLQLSDMLLAFQMIYPSISNGPPKDFWEYLNLTWDPSSGTYCGPGWKESQSQSEPQTSLYDYFMGYFSGQLSDRCFKDDPVQLQVGLIQPSDDQTVSLAFPLERQESFGDSVLTTVYRTQKWAYSCIAKENSPGHGFDRTFLPLKVVFGNRHRSHSFVCQGGNIQKIDYRCKDEKIELFLTLSEKMNLESRDKCQEVCLFVDHDEQTKISVDAAIATTFQLGSELLIAHSDLKIAVSFQVYEGKGEFFGHIMKGNRPSQVAAKGRHRFDAYDWQIFLRTLERTERCVIQVSLEILE